MLSQSVDLKLLDLDNSNDPDLFFLTSKHQENKKYPKLSSVTVKACTIYLKPPLKKKKNNQKTTEKYLRF